MFVGTLVVMVVDQIFVDEKGKFTNDKRRMKCHVPILEKKNRQTVCVRVCGDLSWQLPPAASPVSLIHSSRNGAKHARHCA
jgi:hypothetical protein